MSGELRRLVEVRFLRFVAVGVLNSAFSYAVYAALLVLGLNFALANLGALVLGILFSFKTQGALVFRNPDNRLIVRFILSWAVLYGVNIAVIAAFMAAGLDAYWSGLLALPVIAAFSYVVQRHVVFGAGRQNA